MIPLKAIHEATIAFSASLTQPLAKQDYADAMRPLEMWIDAVIARPSIANLIMYGAVLPENSDIPDAFAKIGKQSLAIFEQTFRQMLPDASAEEMHHIASTITGTVLFYSNTLNQITGKTGKVKHSASQVRHKELVMYTAKKLIQEIGQRSSNQQNKTQL